MSIRKHVIWIASLVLALGQAALVRAQEKQQQPSPKPVTPPPVVPGQKPPREPAVPGRSSNAQPDNAQVAAARSRPLAAGEDAAVLPFIDDNVLGVARVDLDRVDVHAYQQWLDGALEKSSLDPQRRRAAQDKLSHDLDRADRWLQGMRKAGAHRLYVVMSLSDAPDRPPILVVPLARGADAKSLIVAILSEPAGPQQLSAEQIGDAVVAASSTTLSRLKQSPQSHTNPDLAAAMAASDPAPLRIAVIPGPDVRKTLQAASPTLPDELGGGPITNVTLGMRWIALSLTAPPEPAFKFIVQARDAQDAKALADLAGKTADAIRARAKDWELPFDLEQAIALVMPKLRGDRIVTNLDASQTRAFIGSIIAPVAAGRVTGDEPEKK